MPCQLEYRTLANRFVTLEPLTAAHKADLSIAGSAPSIWVLQPFNIAQGFDAYFDWLIAERDSGHWMPFAVLNHSGRLVGQTCFLDIKTADCGIEIGGTWYSPEVQGTAINPASKFLLLDHAFSSGMVRVQFKTDAINFRSRAAIEKLGASFEGIFRKHKLRPDGTYRDTVYYSITDDDWPVAREALAQRIGDHPI